LELLKPSRLFLSQVYRSKLIVFVLLSESPVGPEITYSRVITAFLLSISRASVEGNFGLAFPLVTKPIANPNPYLNGLTPG
jgi:hypothetical protein